MKKTTFIKFYTIILLMISLRATGSVVDSIESPKLWLEQQNTIGQDLLKNGQEFNRAVRVLKNAHDFALSQGLSDQFTEISVGYGIAMYRNGEIQKAHSILLDALPNISNDSLKQKAEVNQIIGMTLVFQDKFPAGYKYQMDALTYYSDIKDSSGLMSIYYDLGANFGTQNQSKLALKNYEKGIAIARSIGDKKKIILGTTALGGTWASLNDYDQALGYLSESFELAKALNDDEELAWASINRGHILGQIERYEEAEYFLKQAYELSFKIGNKLLTAYSLEQLSEMSIKQDQLDKAIADLGESYEIYRELGQINSIKGVTKKYAEIYYKQKNFAKYKEYTDKYIALKDSLYSEKMMASMANLKQDFEILKLERENQIALLTKDKELAKTKNYVTISMICGAILVFILLLALMFSRGKAATEKNALLSAKNAEIIRRNEFLISSNRDLEKFAYIISHDLKEPLRNINGFTKLLNRKLEKYTFDQDIGEYATFITNGTQQMEELLNGLLAYSKVSVNKDEKEVANLENIARKVINNLKIQLGEKNCEVVLEPMPKVACRKMQITQVFQNLIANAVKFGKREGNKISIGAEEKANEYRFFVKDIGIGIDQEYQDEIFEVFKRLHDRGTYSGSGIGLATCKKIVDDHGGRIWVESQKGKGACFFFTLPKKPTEEVLMTGTPDAENAVADLYTV